MVSASPVSRLSIGLNLYVRSNVAHCLSKASACVGVGSEMYAIADRVVYLALGIRDVMTVLALR